MRGAGRDRHERAVGCGGRGGALDETRLSLSAKVSTGPARRSRLAETGSADGEVVWSWRPGAGAKSCGSKIRQMTVARKPVTGESTKEAVKPLRRECRIASAEPVCSCAHSSHNLAHETAGAARTRHSLLPLLWEKGRNVRSHLGQIVPRECKAMFEMATAIATHSLSSPAQAGDPVRRGFSAQALLSLEYWIARSSRATTSESEIES